MSTKTATAKAPRVQLGRDVLIARALELTDSEGLEAVTVRRLAQDLGVTPMALYWHFHNKDELLEAMGDHVMESVRVDFDSGVSWDVQLELLVTGLVDALRAHPALAQLAAERILLCEAGMELTERTLALLRGAGFDIEQSATVAHHALLSALMLITGEPGAEGQVGAEERAARHDAKQAGLQALDPERYPNVIAAFSTFIHCADEDDYYGTGVQLFVDGVRGMHRRLIAG